MTVAPPDPARSTTGVPVALARTFDGIGRLGVAFSGGVDSSVVLAAAVRTLGADRVVAVLGVSPSLPASERTAAPITCWIAATAGLTPTRALAIAESMRPDAT